MHGMEKAHRPKLFQGFSLEAARRAMWPEEATTGGMCGWMYHAFDTNMVWRYKSLNLVIGMYPAREPSKGMPEERDQDQ